MTDPLRRRSYLYALERLRTSARLALDGSRQLVVFVPDAQLRAQLTALSLDGVVFSPPSAERAQLLSRSSAGSGNNRRADRNRRPSNIHHVVSRPPGVSRVAAEIQGAAGLWERDQSMRIRTVKPEFWSHRKLKHEPPGVQLLALGLISMADDEGFLWAGASDVRDAVRQGERVLPRVDRDLRRLIALKYLVTVETEEGTLGFLPTFLDHQVINKPSPSKLRRYWPPDSGSIPGVLPERSRGEGKGSGNGTGIRDQGYAAGAATSEEHEEEPVVRPPGKATNNPALAAFEQHQRERKTHGFDKREKLPKTETLDRWWGEWLSLLDYADNGTDGPRLKKARELYFADDYWRPKGFPFAGFLSQSRDLVAQIRANAA